MAKLVPLMYFVIHGQALMKRILQKSTLNIKTFNLKVMPISCWLLFLSQIRSIKYWLICFPSKHLVKSYNFFWQKRPNMSVKIFKFLDVFTEILNTPMKLILGVLTSSLKQLKCL